MEALHGSLTHRRSGWKHYALKRSAVDRILPSLLLILPSLLLTPLTRCRYGNQPLYRAEADRHRGSDSQVGPRGPLGVLSRAAGVPPIYPNWVNLNGKKFGQYFQ